MACVTECSLNVDRDVTAADSEGRTALHYICSCRSALSTQLVRCLIDARSALGLYTRSLRLLLLPLLTGHAKKLGGPSPGCE